MKNTILLVLIYLFHLNRLFSQEPDSLQSRIKEIEHSLVYINGAIVLDSGNAVLTIPPSFKFLNRPQSVFVLSKIFGNPNDNSLLGMLVPKNKGILDKDGWVFTISYQGIGYVEDKGANEINYDEILDGLKKEVKEENIVRITKGYNSYELIGWASPPFYDQHKKVLHWAKEVRFGKDKVNTLNYNLRILGRKGVYVLNAIASMSQLKEVESLIDEVIGSIQFLKGYKYEDFKPGFDKEARFNIKALVSGKIIPEEGIFRIIIKNWIAVVLAFIFLILAIWVMNNKSRITNPYKSK